jgi:anti-sigma regulatory factor (Ser/Thr protein kinase)
VAIGTHDIETAGGEHAVKFYESDAELVEAVHPYLSGALRDGAVAIVIATQPHLHALEHELRSGGADLAAARAQDAYFALDAEQTLAELRIEGHVDRQAFEEVVGRLVRGAGASGRTIRAYGEMVALLWDAGDVIGAIELEEMWNELARELPFALLCSYPAASVSGSEHADALHEVCQLHTSVLSPPVADDLDAAARLSQTGVTAGFPGVPEAPGRARRLVAATLRQCGFQSALVDRAALVSSELATNAVLHANSPFSLTLEVRGTVLRIAVADTRPLADDALDGGLIARSGHGLAVIEMLASDWGVQAAPNGKLVWAELRL